MMPLFWARLLLANLVLSGSFVPAPEISGLVTKGVSAMRFLYVFEIVLKVTLFLHPGSR